MRKYPVDALQPGMVLGRSLFSGANTLALAAGQTLDQRYIKLLEEQGYHSVFIEDDGFEEISPHELLSDTVRRVAESTVNKGIETLAAAVKLKSDASEITKQLLLDQPDLFNIPNVQDMSRAVSNIVRDIIDRNIFLVDVFAQVTSSTYLYSHAVNVATLSVLIARQFGFTSRQLRELAFAALLHDFGKVALGPRFMAPKHELNGDDKLRFEEHPTFGAILIENTDPTLKSERLAILHHHEWQSGKGYPQGIGGDNQPPTRDTRGYEGIHRYGEIIAVAESYDNLVNGNSDLDRRLDPADALGLIMSFSHKRFNQAVCHAFSQIVYLYPTGSMVRVEKSSAFGLEGYYAVVKEQGPTPTRPQLILYADQDGRRVRAKTIDLSTDRDLRLKLMV